MSWVSEYLGNLWYIPTQNKKKRVSICTKNMILFQQVPTYSSYDNNYVFMGRKVWVQQHQLSTWWMWTQQKLKSDQPVLSSTGSSQDPILFHSRPNQTTKILIWLQMSRLIWVFTVWTCSFVGFAVPEIATVAEFGLIATLSYWGPFLLK